MRLLAIDGNSLINRAFYGVRELNAPDGTPTNAVYGFLSIWFKLFAEYQPDAAVVAFDMRTPTFRHKTYDGYKATRKGMPDELAVQMPILKDVLSSLGIKTTQCEGWEADDILGTTSRMCGETGDECFIVTGDRDSFQLVMNNTTKVILVSTQMGRTETVVVDRDELERRYGLRPEQLIDLKALMGDSSDNIPGVPGIGEKTALELMHTFGGLDAIFEGYADFELKPSVKKKLDAGKDSAYLSKMLGTIDQNAPVDFKPSDCVIQACKEDELYNHFVHLGFKNYITKMNLKPTNVSKNVCISEKSIKITFENIENINSLKSLISDCKAEKLVSYFLTEDAEAMAIVVDQKGYLVLAKDFSLEDFEKFVEEFMNEEISKSGYNFKPLILDRMNRHLPFGGFVFDIYLGAYLLDPTDSTGYPLDALAAKYGLTPPDMEILSTPGAFGALSDANGAIEELKNAATAVASLEKIIRQRLNDLGMMQLYCDVELPLTEVLASMQHEGMAVDREKLQEFSASLGVKISEIEGQIYDLAGEKFNILSPKQLSEILFIKLGLPPVKKTKSGYSTDNDVMEKLIGSHEIIEPLIEYRKLSKLRSTYADGLQRFISADGRIHSTFHQAVTATGRISSAEPNLQNIPIRQELGSEIRRMFVPREHFVFVDADYSQIELRVLAHISDDPVMKNAFISGEDIHRSTASQVFGVSPKDVTSVMRSRAKAVNFGIVYGISEHSLSEDIGVGYGEAKQYMENYLSKFSGVRDYMDRVKEQARADGFVTTLMGRRRNLPELKSSNFNIRAFGERVALNTPIQGTAADIIKVAMVDIYRKLREKRSKIVLQVHDEIIVEAAPEELVEVMKIVTESMEGAMKLSVPLRADASCGKNWFEAKK